MCLDDDDGGVDDDAEVDGANRDEIGGVAGGTIIPNAKRMAKGIVSAAMMAVRRSPRNTRSSSSDQAQFR